MNIERVLQVNRKVEITIIDGPTDADQNLGQSLIQEIYNDSFSIMVPVRVGHTLYLEKGDEVMVSILSDDARYSFKSEVIDKRKEAGIRYVLLKKPLKLTTSERRNLVRAKTLLSIKYVIIQNEEEKHWENIEPVNVASVIDLSGKGISLSLNQPLETDLQVVLSIPLEINNIRATVKLLGKVVRCEQSNGFYRIGVKFENINEKQEDLIMKYVFYALRKYIQVARDDY